MAVSSRTTLSGGTLALSARTSTLSNPIARSALSVEYVPPSMYGRPPMSTVGQIPGTAQLAATASTRSTAPVRSKVRRSPSRASTATTSRRCTGHVCTGSREASSQGISTMFVPADDDDTHALRFYAALGGKPSKVTLFEFSSPLSGAHEELGVPNVDTLSARPAISPASHPIPAGPPAPEPVRVVSCRFAHECAAGVEQNTPPSFWRRGRGCRPHRSFVGHPEPPQPEIRLARRSHRARCPYARLLGSRAATVFVARPRRACAVLEPSVGTSFRLPAGLWWSQQANAQREQPDRQDRGSDER